MDNSVDRYAIAVNYIKNQFKQPENQLPKDTADRSIKQTGTFPAGRWENRKDK